MDVFRCSVKYFLAIVVLATAANTQDFKAGEKIANWTLMGESETGKLYFAPDSIRRNGDIVKVWLKIDFPFGSEAVSSEPLRAGKDFGSIRGYGVIDCSNLTATSGSILVLYYDRNGHLIKRQKETDRIKSNNGPNGLAAIFSYFCENVEVPPTGPPRLKSKPKP